jgi:hypothetical protein
MELDIPYDIVGIILTKSNREIKCMLNDEVLQRFIIKYSQIHPETLLMCLVKQRKKKALVIYTSTKKQQILTISDNVLKCLCTVAIRNNDIDIVKHLVDIYFIRFKKKHIFENVIKMVLNEYVKSQSEELIAFIKDFLHFVSNDDYVINKHLLIKTLKHNKLNEILDLLLSYGYIHSSAYYDNNIITITISNNHYDVLKYFVDNGHKIDLYDIIIGISTSNGKMIKYILSYFKPRLYSKGFSNLLLSLTALRKNSKIVSYVEERLIN